jgi:hypothetical protein
MVDTETGELLEVPQVDFEGAPWMYVLTQENVWDSHKESWTRWEAIENLAIDRLSHLFTYWGDK